MSRLVVAPIVEGHGEDNAIRLLIQRIWTELLGGEFVQVIKPIRWPRSRLVQSAELKRAVNLAVLKLQSADLTDPAMILILLDADQDPPCTLGPDLLRHASRSDIDVSCVVANVDYETWFVAAAASLSEFLLLPPVSELPTRPEESRLGKAWVQRLFRGPKYSETLDQPAMTKSMDLGLCRERSPSFDKLCRELHARLGLSG